MLMKNKPFGSYDAKSGYGLSYRAVDVVKAVI